MLKHIYGYKGIPILALLHLYAFDYKLTITFQAGTRLKYGPEGFIFW